MHMLALSVYDNLRCSKLRTQRSCNPNFYFNFGFSPTTVHYNCTFTNQITFPHRIWINVPCEFAYLRCNHSCQVCGFTRWAMNAKIIVFQSDSLVLFYVRPSKMVIFTFFCRHTSGLRSKKSTISFGSLGPFLLLFDCFVSDAHNFQFFFLTLRSAVFAPQLHDLVFSTLFTKWKS